MHELERGLATKDFAPQWSGTHAERVGAGGRAHDDRSPRQARRMAITKFQWGFASPFNLVRACRLSYENKTARKRVTFIVAVESTVPRGFHRFKSEPFLRWG
jgi:hypothetical protein